MRVLFKDNEVQRLLDDYQRLVGVRIAVFDIEFNELYSSPKTLSPFCQSIRENPEINEACQHCDKQAFRKAKANKDTYIYRCHLGLYEAITPLNDRQQILGYVMIGQVLGDANKEIQWQSLTNTFKATNPSLHISKAHYYNLKQMNIDDIEAISRIMKACASSIWLQHIINIIRSPIADRIDQYIEQHYYEKLTTNKICHDLGASKTTIYNTLKEEHNMSLTQYVNHYRLIQSKKLLKQKKLPISKIACTVGFEDYNYFTRLFKEAFHTTPSQYQKNLP